MGPKTKQTTDNEIENPPQFKHPKLITLTKNLNKELAVEVENCWINPEKITTGNVLGNGTSFCIHWPYLFLQAIILILPLTS